MSERIIKAAKEDFETFAKIFREEFLEAIKKKEPTTMQVSYNGFTGEFVKLEQSHAGKFEFPVGLTEVANIRWLYDLSIYDSEKRVTHTFDGVKLEDIKFLGGAVSFGG